MDYFAEFLLFMIWKNAEGVEGNMKELSNYIVY